MQMTSDWVAFIAGAGNRPGNQQGDVEVHLAASVAGMKKVTCASADLSLVVEAGQFIGCTVMTGGRHLFLPATNVAGIIDAPLSGGKD
jgi:hypothetical protein